MSIHLGIRKRRFVSVKRERQKAKVNALTRDLVVLLSHDKENSVTQIHLKILIINNIVALI